MVGEIKLLQVGDVHLPDHATKPLVDVKDASFPSRVTNLATPKPLQSVLRELARQSSHADALLFCGDLTSRGDLDYYERCVEHLTSLLGLKTRTLESLHAVPGNHDINRTIIEAEDLFAKFRPLELAWKRHSVPILATTECRATTISADGCRAQIFSLNSCIGCGETRFLPEELRTQLGSLLADYAHEKGGDDSFKLLGDTLDTPAFAIEDIDSVCDAIVSLEDTVAPIVLAHHNLLPQAIVRVAMYTEALNAGLVRSRLARLKQPILYLHGHIHDDPVEFVTHPDSAPLFSISAPELVEGFNMITLQYGRKKMPLGCTVVPYRLHHDGSVGKRDEIRIPFFYQRHKLSECFVDRRLNRCLLSLSNRYEQFEDVLAKIKKGQSEQIGETTLATLLREAEWLGLAAIVNRSEVPRLWQVRKTL